MIHMCVIAGLEADALYTLEDRYQGKLDGPIFSIVHVRAQFLKTSIIMASLSVAFITILETLISAKIAEHMTSKVTRSIGGTFFCRSSCVVHLTLPPQGFNQPQEVLAVGLANIAAGVFGGLPATAALARTSLNVKSGATGRTSGI